MSSHIKIHQHICLELFWTVFACNRCLICAYFFPASGETTFLLEKAHILAGSNDLKLKCLNDEFVSYKHSFSLHKTLTDGLERCGLLVDYCDVFISCLGSHSDGTHSLQRIQWWASDVMLHFSKSDEETNLRRKQTYLGWGWGHFQQIFIFGWTILLIAKLNSNFGVKLFLLQILFQCTILVQRHIFTVWEVIHRMMSTFYTVCLYKYLLYCCTQRVNKQAHASDVGRCPVLQSPWPAVLFLHSAPVPRLAGLSGACPEERTSPSLLCWNPLAPWAISVQLQNLCLEDFTT